MSRTPPAATAPRRRVIDALRLRGPLARVELADATGLSPATVTAATSELIADGFIEDVEAVQPADGGARRGRPRVRLRLRPDAAVVAGVKVSMHQVSVSISNFVGELLGADAEPAPRGRPPSEGVADRIERALRRCAAGLGLSLSDIAGVGVGAPGFIDPSAGLSLWSPVFGEGPKPIAAMLSRRLGRPVFIDNDANLAALAQRWFGAGRGLETFLTVTIEHGVGMGVVIDGRLHRGARGFGAEFGHMKIQRSGALCRCGQRGCIEAYLADYAILREVSVFRPLRHGGDPVAAHQALLEIVAAGCAGDRRIQDVYARAGEILGFGLANLVNIFGPERVILTGEGVAAAALFEPAMRRAFAENALSVSRDLTPLVVEPNSDALWAHGAAALVLERLAFGASADAEASEARAGGSAGGPAAL